MEDPRRSRRDRGLAPPIAPVTPPPARHVRRFMVESARTFPVWGPTGRLAVTEARRMPVAWGRLQAEIAAVGAACDGFRAESELSRVNAAGAGRWMAAGPRRREHRSAVARRASVGQAWLRRPVWIVGR
jgi:hypothetical protein